MFVNEGRAVFAWRDDVSTFSWSFFCVLHALLGLSALHFARTSAENKARNAGRATDYCGLKMTEMVMPLQNVDDSNANALYVAASLSCFYNLALGPQPGQYLAFGDEGEAEWPWHQHGARAIHLSHPGALSRGWPRRRQPYAQGSPQKFNNADGLLNPSFLPGFESQLVQLRDFASTLLAEHSTFEEVHHSSRKA